MRNKKRWQSLAAWTLALSMTMSNSGFLVMAESLDTPEQAESESENAVLEGDAELATEAETEPDTSIEILEESENEPEILDEEAFEGEAFDDGGFSDGADEFISDSSDEIALFESEENPDEENPDEGDDYSIWFYDLRNDGYSTFVFDNEYDYEFPLNTDNLENVDATIQWQVGFRTDGDENGNDQFTEYEADDETSFWQINEDNSGVQINGEYLANAYKWLYEKHGDAYWFEIRATAIQTDEENSDVEIGWAQAGIWSREAVMDYHLSEFDNIRLVPNGTRWINGEQNCYVEDAEHPGGENIGYQIVSVDVANADGEGDEAICHVEEQESGWQLIADRSGHAILTVTYADVYNEDETYKCSGDIWVNADQYHIEANYPDDKQFMAPESEMEIGLSLYHEWYYDDEDRGYDKVEITDCSIELYANEDGFTYDSDLIDASIRKDEENGEHVLTVNSKKNYGGTNIHLRALVGDDEVEQCDIYVEVSSYYDKITGDTIENIPVGDYLDFNNYNIKVEHYENGEFSDRDNTEVVYQIAYYNPDVWEMTETKESELPVLRRINKWGDNVGLAAFVKDEEGNLQQIDNRDYWFDELDYSVWFEGLRNDEYSTDIYDTEDEYVLSLNTGNLEGLNAKIQWEIGYRTETDEEDNDQFTEFEATEETRFWSFDPECSTNLLINGAKLANAYDWLREQSDLEGDYWFEVRALVMADTGEDSEGIEVFTAQAGVNSRKTFYDYGVEEFAEREIILTNSEWISRRRNCYVSAWMDNDDFQGYYDGNMEYEITSVTAQNVDEANEEPVCIVEEDEEGNGWNVRGNSLGDAIITISYTDIQTGETREFSGIFHVVNDYFYLENRYPENRSHMPFNSVMEINMSLHYEWYFDEEDRGDEEIKDYALMLNPDEEGSAYDDSVVDVELQQKEDGSWSVLVRSKQKNEGTNIRVKAVVKDEAGNEQTVTETDLWVQVCQETDMIKGEVPDDILPGEKLDFNQLNLEVRHYENEDSYVRDDVRYQFEYDENCWTKEESEEYGDLPVFTRINAYDTWLAVIAEVQNENGDWEEIDRRDVYFDGIDYTTWFEDLRDGDSGTWAFEDESYPLHLNTENLQDKNANIQWEIGYETNGEGDTFKPITEEDFGKFWSENEDDPYTLNIDGALLKEAYTKLYATTEEDIWFSVAARVMSGDVEVNYVRCGLFTRDNVIIYDYPANRYVEFLPGETGYINDTFWCYVENKDHPEGRDLELAVTDVTVKTTDPQGGEEPITVKKEDGYWTVHANYVGNAEATITYVDFDGETVATHSFALRVKDVVYYIVDGAESPDRTDWMLNGEEKDIPIAVYRQTRNEDGTYNNEKLAEDTYTLTVGDAANDDPGYETTLLESVTVKGSHLIVRSRAGAQGSTGIYMTVVSKEKTETGNAAWATEGWTTVAVDGQYYVISPGWLDEEDPYVGETLDLNKYNPSVTLTLWVDGTEKVTETCENIRYHLEYDENCWKVVEGTENQEIPVLERTSKAPADVTLVAEERHYDGRGNEIWEYVASQNYGFARILECTHKWEVSEEKAATCTAEGSITYTCRRCKETKTETIPKLAHTIVTVTDSQATCGVAGKQHQECSMCHGERTELPDIPATGKHNWVVVKTIAASCTAAGSRVYTCTSCKASKTEEIKKLAHDMVTVVDSQPTCGKVGKQHKECSLCHGERVELPDLAATGKHSWSEYVVSTEATALAAGEEVRTCQVCGVKENRTIPQLKAFIKVASTSFPLKNGQSLKVAVTLEKGDKIKSVASGNKKKLTVSAKGNTITLKANKAATSGKVKVTIKTASGLSKKLTVTLQEEKVVAKKITGVPKKLTIKVKKSAALKPVVTPISNTDKVTYTSSNKKVVTVSTKGVLKAKKAGKATITVKCGDVSVKCTVTVKK